MPEKFARVSCTGMRITNGLARATAVSLVLLFSGLHAQEEQDTAPATLEELRAAVAKVVAENDVPAFAGNTH